MAEIIKLDLLKITVVTFKLQYELGILCHVTYCKRNSQKFGFLLLYKDITPANPNWIKFNLFLDLESFSDIPNYLTYGKVVIFGVSWKIFWRNKSYVRTLPHYKLKI